MSEPKDIDELYYKYPQLFPKNCIECNVGWYEIVDHMCLAIQTYIDKELSDEVLFPEFKYIREKFGVLDIELEDSDPILDIVTKSAEILSYHVCEYCGDEGELYCSAKWRTWSHYKTLCLDHAIEFYYYKLYRDTEFA
tara:strand:+ start:817 stop:1230 length:414 start_codon:yes stop_codon:yes gene_type:complete